MTKFVSYLQQQKIAAETRLSEMKNGHLFTQSGKDLTSDMIRQHEYSISSFERLIAKHDPHL